VTKVDATATLTRLAGAKAGDVNSMTQPPKVFPVETRLEGIAPHFSHAFPARSVSVVRIRTP
jgi:alpha-L-arabinofuranosidase